jgi:hypothetical protein
MSLDTTKFVPPTSLQCVGCFLLIIQFPGLIIAMALSPGNYALMICVVPSAMIATNAMSFLMTGRAAGFFTLALDIFRGKVTGSQGDSQLKPKKNSRNKK